MESAQDGEALVAALLYGRIEGISEELLFLFSRTGLVHLFSASGFHLAAASALAAGLVLPFRRLLGRGRPWLALRFGARLALMLFFGAATDWSSPMVRAFAFTALLAAAELLEKRPNRTRVFLLSLVAAAALGRGGHLSFVLSACGMAGVLYVQPRKAWPKMLTEALGPWIFTLPVTVWCFGLFSPLAPLWNLTFGALISFLVLPPAILALALSALGLPTTYPDWLSATAMRLLVEGLARAEATLGWALWVAPWRWALLSLGLLTAAHLWRRRKLSALIAFSALALSSLLPSPDLALLDVGQGDALLLRQGGAWALSDAGPPGLGFPAPVTGRLEAYGVGALAHVVLSHGDLDHRGGLGSLFTRHPAGALWIREAMLGEKGALSTLEAAERAGVKIFFLNEGAAPPGWECWAPPAGSHGNEGSPLCRARTDGGRSVLLTGDMGERTEAWFLERLRPFPRAAYLKVPHHGSRGSSSGAFLRATGAHTALIGVGRRNRYGHPSRETLARLEAAGMGARRTDRQGSVAFYFSAGAVAFTEEIMREEEPSRLKPGTPALTSRAYAWPAEVK